MPKGLGMLVLKNEEFDAYETLTPLFCEVGCDFNISVIIAPDFCLYRSHGF